MKSLPLLSNHPRVRRWTAAVVASAVALGVCLASYDNVDAAIKQNRIERLNARIENVYTAIRIWPTTSSSRKKQVLRNRG